MFTIRAVPVSAALIVNGRTAAAIKTGARLDHPFLPHVFMGTLYPRRMKPDPRFRLTNRNPGGSQTRLSAEVGNVMTLPERRAAHIEVGFGVPARLPAGLLDARPKDHGTVPSPNLMMMPRGSISLKDFHLSPLDAIRQTAADAGT
jgi:hypothetical protein